MFLLCDVWMIQTRFIRLNCFNSNMQVQMRKNLREEGRAYRDYSRERYVELKAMRNHMSESEIVRQIIMEWQKKESPKKEMNGSDKKTQPKMGSSKKKEQTNMMPEKEEEVQKALFRKNKPIAKMDRKTYMQFNKEMWKDLKKQHPNWNDKQMNEIIRLEWRLRKKNNAMMMTKGKRLFSKMAKGGRQTLRMMKKITPNEAMMMWKKFPRETKLNWKRRGMMMAMKDMMEPMDNNKMITVNLNMQMPGSLSFMNNSM